MGTGNLKMVSFRLDEADVEKYHRLAQFRRISFTAWVRNALETQAREDDRLYWEYDRIKESREAWRRNQDEDR